MRVKIGDRWYDANEQAICIELSAQDKLNIENMNPDCDKYAVFPDKDALTSDEMRYWMATEEE